MKSLGTSQSMAVYGHKEKLDDWQSDVLNIWNLSRRVQVGMGMSVYESDYSVIKDAAGEDALEVLAICQRMNAELGSSK